MSKVITMSVKVTASLFSSFIGRHRYRSQDETIEELYQRYESKTYEDLDVPLPEALIPLVNKRELTKEDYEIASSIDPIHVIKDQVEHIVLPTQQLAIARGVALESCVLDDLNDSLREQGLGYQAIPDNTLYRKRIDGIELIGVVDGLLVDERSQVIGVVEIKNRLRGFFNDKKLEDYKYDIDQLMCYYKLLEDQSEILMLVQCWNGKLKSSTYSREYMEERWNGCQESLSNAVEKYHEYRLLVQ